MSALSKKWFLMSWPLWVFVALFKLGGSVFYTALPALGEQVFPLWIVGLFVGGSSFVQLLLDIPAGVMLDHFGYTRVLKIASGILSLGGLLLILFGNSVWTYPLLIVVSGCGWLFFGPGVDAYTLGIAPVAKAGRYLGIKQSVGSVGGLIGTILFTALLVAPVSMLGVAIFVPLVCAMGVASFLKKEPRHPSDEQRLEAVEGMPRKLYFKKVLKAMHTLNPASGLLAFSAFASAVFYGAIWFVIPLYLQSQADVGALQFGLGIFDVAVILCGGLVGKLADSKDKQFYVFIGLFVSALAGTIMGFNLDAWFLLFGFIASVGDEMASVSLWSWMNQLNKDRAHHGLIASFIGFAQDIGWVVGPILAGVLYGRIGASWTIFCGCVLVYISWLVSALIVKKSVVSLFYSALPPLQRPPHATQRD